MTIRKWAEEYLFKRGMFEDDARVVVQATVDAKGSEAMAGRWDDEIEGYPPSLLALLTMALDREALAHIDKNCPKAWYRPMFVRHGTVDKPGAPS